MASPRGGRPRIRDRDEPRQHVGFPVPVGLKRRLELAAAFNGRSLSQEGVERLSRSFQPEIGFPPEIEAFLELLGRAMLEAGESITKTNRTAGHEAPRNWVEDDYALAQAIRAGLRILELGLPDKAEPHGLFASPDYPQEAAQDFGKRIADGILEVMRGRHEAEPGSTIPAAGWIARVRQSLGSIGERLDRHPPPEDYILASRRRATPEEAAETITVIEVKPAPDGDSTPTKSPW